MQSVLNKLAALSVVLASASVIWTVSTMRFTKRIPAAVTPSAEAADVPSGLIPLRDAAVIGGDARAGVIVYSDFQCPYCARFAKDTFPKVVKAYVATGRAFVAFRHLPLEAIHPHALRAAATAECGRRQGKFWDVHDAIFLASPHELGTVKSDKLARSLGMNVKAFENCVNGDGQDAVRRDAADANSLGVRGTPTFFFGIKENGNAVRVIRREGGAIPFRAFKAILEDTMKKS